MNTTPNATPRMSNPRLMLIIENAVIMAVMLGAYYHFRGDALVFVLLFLVPDLSALGYLVNKQVGAMSYNAIHTYAMPIGLLLIALAQASNVLILLAIIWGFHIAIDRVMGYGFKYASAFKDTHLQRV